MFHRFLSIMLLVFAYVPSGTANDALDALPALNPMGALEPLLPLPSCNPLANSTPQLRIALIQQRHERVRARASRLSACLGQPVDPLSYKDLAARRFINSPDWEKYLEQKAASNDAHIDPSEVYKPKPATWNNWWSTLKEKVNPAIQSHAPFNLSLLQGWNVGALSNLQQSHEKPGVVRDFASFSDQGKHSTSLTHEQIQILKDFRMPGLDAPILRWTNRVCLEDLPRDLKLSSTSLECQKLMLTSTALSLMHRAAGSSNELWRNTQEDLKKGLLEGKWYRDKCWPQLSDDDARKQTKVCGLFYYAPEDKVPQLLANLLLRVNSYLQSHPGNRTPDPIRFALDAQRQLVALHPFRDGNGRLSRWLMDAILLRSGFPPVMIPDMNRDLTTSLDVWVSEGYAGAEKALGIMEECTQEHELACSKKNRSEALATVKKGRCGTLD